MVLIATLALVVASAGGPKTGQDGWAGTWKSTDPEVYATIEVTDVGAGGFALSWDENVGIQGARATGRAIWLGPDRARFETPECALTLTRRGARLEAALEKDSCFNWSSHKAISFIREGVTVHQRTSFDCTKASGGVEKAICADRDLARADRVLAEKYQKMLRSAGHLEDVYRAAQRDWVARRDADCAAADGRQGCLLRTYGRRLLELRVFPDTPFEGGRVNVAVVKRAISGKGAIEASGVRELAAGLVGGTPDEMSLEPHDEPGGIWLAGCDEPDRSQGYDPLGMNCGRQHYIAFREDGAIWAAWADADGVKIVPEPKRGQKLPGSLEDFRENHGPPDDPSPPDRPDL